MICVGIYPDADWLLTHEYMCLFPVVLILITVHKILRYSSVFLCKLKNKKSKSNRQQYKFFKSCLECFLFLKNVKIILHKKLKNCQQLSNSYKIRVNMVFNVFFNNISVILWRSILLVEENGSTCRKPSTCRKSLTNFII